MRYQLFVSKAVLKSVEKINSPYKEKIKMFIYLLSDSIKPEGYDIKKLSGENNTYRCRINNYRIVYAIQNNKLIIEVISVADRKDVYK